MTRREEIKLRAEEYRQPYRDGGYRLSSKDVRDAFEESAQWADKTMIEKACKWLINIDFDDFHFRDCDETFNNDLFVDAFKRAMEE